MDNNMHMGGNRYNITRISEPIITLPEPFPEVMVSGKNKKLAKRLLVLFAGPCSKLTEAIQLHNHHIHYMDCEPKMAGMVFDAIGNSDIQQWHMIGRAILKLGMEIPIGHIMHKEFMAWCGKYVKVKCTLHERIKADIMLKKSVIMVIEDIMKMCEDMMLRPLFERMIREEKYHISVLQKLLVDFPDVCGCKEVHYKPMPMPMPMPKPMPKPMPGVPKHPMG
jgi:bacterioferritin (cytochrome b1)